MSHQPVLGCSVFFVLYWRQDYLQYTRIKWNLSVKIEYRHVLTAVNSHLSSLIEMIHGMSQNNQASTYSYFYPVI